jgi:hypothetical protein
MKSPLITFWTSGSRKRSPVPLSCVRSAGARMSGRGVGSDVRWGFCDMAASMASLDSGGVTRVMSAKSVMRQEEI